MKERRAMFHLVNPAFLHLGQTQWDFEQYWSGSPGGSTLDDGIPIQWRGLYYLIWPLFPTLTQALPSCLWLRPGHQTLEAGLGNLVPVILLASPSWVGS